MRWVSSVLTFILIPPSFFALPPSLPVKEINFIPFDLAYLIALIIGGSLGNLFDRIYYYAVPDFIDLHLGNYHWFIFNVADIFITVGIIGLILVELVKKEKISKNA